MVSAERLRLDEADTGGVPWQRWGPYLSERQWGTVREDYGSGDNTWSYFPREQVRWAQRPASARVTRPAGPAPRRCFRCSSAASAPRHCALAAAAPSERGSGPANGRGAMTGWPGQPVIYEINTAVWLDELARASGRPVTLADVAAADWDAAVPAGVDAVWLMGVWERSPAGLVLANANAELQASFAEALPDVRRTDVIGSPYCVRRYAVDAGFGGPDGLAAARAALAARGARLILDYVPNHVAPDHPWVTSRPELFVRGDEDDIKADPAGWIAAAGQVLAHGRDPYFPPWPDVVQLDAFSPAMRAATAGTLADIASQCDGIRCDMAMLMINRIFGTTWRDRAGPEPAAEFWPAVLAELRARHPDTVMIAEAYWDKEWELQQQGFGFCYDKRLYDRIIAQDVSGVRDHLRGDPGYQAKLVRFLENHDEPRIASCLPGDAERAAAVAIATLPGATLWHEGQFEGRRVRPPVFLSRRPDEPPDAELAAGTGAC